MSRVVAALATALALAAVAAGPARAAAGPADVAPQLTRGTFTDPPATVRPKYRWWQPLAYTDDRELAAEVHQMKQAGGGGAEVAAFTVDGDGNRSKPFLETYGWGTPLWADKVRTMLDAAESDGLRLDFTIGPRWPATVPTVTDVDDPAAAKQIVFSREFHRGGTSRSGALPANFDTAPPAGADKTLIAVLAARCADPGCDRQSASPRLLDEASVVDLTAEVGEDGRLSYTFPGDAGDTYALIAFYQTATGQSLSGYTPTVTNYVLDTLSVAGAKATTDFYDEHILTPDVQKLIDAIGDADLFEDSLEIGGTEKWTGDLVREWTKRRGYSPVELLPALAGAGDQGITSQPYFDFPNGVGTRVRDDYRQTLSDLYIANRLDVLRAWTHRHGMHTRIQPYGVPVDSSEAAGHVDVPEGESLAFGQSDGAYSNVEDYKVVATGAHLAGEPVVSDECCAFAGSVWGSTAGNATDASNLQAVYRGFAGGVNQIVWHGFPYLTRGPAGSGAQELWPGMTYGGNTSYSAAFGDKGDPSWSDYRQVNDNVARMQLVLRQGRPRFDVAVYRHDFGMNGGGNTGFGSDRLVQSTSPLAAAGYTYEYLSPAQLDGDDAVLRGGELFPDRSGYHAVVLDDQPTMPLGAARRLLTLARSGMPVAVVGDPPSRVPGYDAKGESAALRDVIDELLRQPSVVRAAGDPELPGALRRAGVTPAAAPDDTESGALLTVRRQADGVDYYFVYNQAATAAQSTLTLRGDGTAYRLDTWSGEIAPVEGARAGHGTVAVPVHLAGNDATVIAVTRRRDATFPGAGPGSPGGGSRSGHAAEAVRLDDWSLSVDSWTPGPSGLPGDTAHTPLGPVALKAAADGSLPAWSRITSPVDLSDVSGVGSYTAHVDLDNRWNRVRGATLDLGAPPVDTVRVTVNGHELAPLDQADLHHVEIGRWLRPHGNTIQVRVASTLLNAVRVAPGTGASGRERMDYGLFGPVTLTPHGGADPYLTMEPLEPALSLADGGFNRAQVVVTNHSSRPAQVTLAASTRPGIAADAPHELTIGAGEAAVVPVGLRDAGVDAGTSTLTLDARADNGARAEATVALRHSADLALNATGAPFPRPIGAASQDRYPARLALDGSAQTFWVSWGKAIGQGPTADDPTAFGVDLGAVDEVGSVNVRGRPGFGPRDYAVQTSLDGETWRTVAEVTDAPPEGRASAFDTVRARYVRMLVTRTWQGTNRNVQLPEFEVTATPRPAGDLARFATVTASSTHSGFPETAVNDGDTDITPWCTGSNGPGWNDNTSRAFPDWLAASWPQPVTVGRIVVDTLDGPSGTCRYAGVRDYDLQIADGGGWRTVASVRGNTDAVVTSRFPATTTTVVRLLVLDSNDHQYSRVVEVEAYAD